MIVIRYLIKEILKNQVAIFFVLIFIFFSQKIINILNLAVRGTILSDLIFPLLIFGIPEMVQLILPLSLFLGLLITYSKLYTNSEVTAMYACGLGKNILIMAALILAFFNILIAVLNVFWILPWSIKYQEQILVNAKANLSLASMVEGQFKITEDQNIVLYIGNAKGKNFTDIFMAQLEPIDNHQHFSVVIAKNGSIQEDQNGNQIMLLDKGTQYEGAMLLGNFRITDFKDYQVVINHKEIKTKGIKIEQNDIYQLWYANDIESKAEFHWRLTLVITVLIMALMVVPLSEVNPRYGRVLSMLPAILVYLVFFMLQSALHSNAKAGEVNPRVTMWLVNITFLLLAIIFNILDSVFMRQLLAKFHKRIT